MSTKSSLQFRPPRERGLWPAFVLAAGVHVVLVALLLSGLQGPRNACTGPNTMVAGHVVSLPLTSSVMRGANQPWTPRAPTASAQSLAANESVAVARHRSNTVKPQHLHSPALRIARAVAAPKTAPVDEMTIAPQADESADREREARLAAMQALAGKPLPESGVVASPEYAVKVARWVRANVVAPFNIQGNPSAVIAVTCTPSGALLSVKLQRPSGNPRWDRAVLAAVEKSDPMPSDVNGATPASFVVTFQPKG
ncbi:cell envelope integrity protein TolA [Trinickia terrae]|uniref:Cell envelope integrity protein TolA n=1 Tax=Trinickia terrae TaxID=2571161 RepID=A0A4U1IF51_9BURK|nr:cell envelope integrity protein TolA [Trinickia terrae]TKC92291.1 cell envelope integrity protein TolA [Trinickia terrae]